MTPRVLLLLSASTLALAGAGAGAVAQQTGAFLIEAPPAAPAPRAQRRQETEAPDARQEPPSRAAPSRITVKPIDAEEGGPDETALRFYAAQNQMKRVAAEIERLRRLYPYWRPPETLVEPASTSTEDEQALWDLFGADRMDDLRIAIQQRQRDEPDWRPSKDLTDKITRKELRMRLLGMWRAGDLNELINTVGRDGYGGDRADIDLQWTVAEAYARMKQTGEALNIYRSIMRTAVDPRERVATIQKAMESLRITDVEPLIEEVRADANGRRDLAQLATEITRARIAAYLRDERAERLPDAEFKAFGDHVRATDDPNQIGLVAWYHLKNKSYNEALEWFKVALDRGGDAMIAHGLANALRELGMKREAEEVAFAWRDALINNSILYIDVLESELTKPVPPFIEPERLMRYAQVTMDLASGEGAQALGWYAYNTCQFDVAYDWFQRAVAWYPKEATVYGLVLAANRSKRSKEVFELANRYDGLFPKVISVIFPDGYQRPPSPCEMIAAGTRAPAGFRAPDITRANAPTAQRHAFGGGTLPNMPQHQPGAWQAPALVPVANDQMPRFARGEFPAIVDAENNRRFASSGKLMGRPATTTTPPAVQTPLRAEQPFRTPLVARRVQGVGPMPYERWGFSLLPGANGQTLPDAPHSAQTAPPGTVWASEPTGSRPVESFTDPFLTMQAISAAPRVPPPTMTRVMPGGVIAPNFMRGAELRPGLDAEQIGVDMTATGSIERGDRDAEELREVERLRKRLPPADALPVMQERGAHLSPARKEDEDASIEWRPQLVDVLTGLGGDAPQARLGCPFFILGDRVQSCLGGHPASGQSGATE